MSFSGEVKDELSKQLSLARHCQLAELAAILCFCGKITQNKNGEYRIKVQTENEAVARKCFTLLKKAFNIYTDIIERGSASQNRTGTYYIDLFEQEECQAVVGAIKYREAVLAESNTVNPMLLKSACCKRAFLRGAYLTIGSMSDPEKSYHLEFVCSDEPRAVQIRDILIGFDIEAKIIVRKKYHVVYVKEGSGIVDTLNVMEAHVSLMKFENLRIIKEVRNSVNRRVNCETANISKTVNAASKQTEDIIYIKEHYGLNNLQIGLSEMAEVRLQFPEASLNELGQYLNPPVGKSGVNHRLRKLSELADKIRG